MHLLMSYCGCIGTLIADTGIVEILSVAFSGVLKMLRKSSEDAGRGAIAASL